MNATLERAAAQIRRWREEPCAFVRDNFQVEPDNWQRKALEAFASKDPEKRRISLQAAVGPGKSALLAWCGWNFLACYGDLHEHPKGAAVSVTEANLKANLWPEMAKWQQRSEFLRTAFTWTASRVSANDHPETWFLEARSWSKTAEPEEQGRTMSGLHSKYVLVLVDESGEIPIAILKVAEQALSNCKFGKILQAGNPSSLDGMLYIAANQQRHMWYVVRITGDPDDPERSPRINLEWAKEQIALYGRDDPWVMYSILGQFPPASINSLLGIEQVQASMERTRGMLQKRSQWDWAQKRLGIDAAWRGDDKWVIFPRQGICCPARPVAMRNPKTQEIGDRIIMARNRWNAERLYFDDTGGYAAGASDYVEAAGYPVVRVDFSGKATDQRFYNKRAEMWWRMAEWVKTVGALPDLPELVPELTMPTYSYKNGRLIIEEKDQIKKHLGRSPDYADGLALTFAEVEMPGNLIAQQQSPAGRAALMQHDPYAELDRDERTEREDPWARQEL